MARHGGLLPRRRDESGVPLARRELGLAPGRLAARGVRSTASRFRYATLGVRGTLLFILRGFDTERPVVPHRCFLAWCTQFQITHVFLEATTGEDGSTPFWRKAGTSLFTYKSRAWRMRYAQAQFQLVKCKDDMAPVFGEGGNLPTRFFEFTSVWRTTRDGHDVASMA